MEENQVGIFNILYECSYKTNCGHRLYHVKCKYCGKESDMMLSDMKRAKTCKHLALNGKVISTKSKWKNQRICKIYRGMVQRCYNPKDKNYKTYGGKGIKICDDWFNNSSLFEEWALKNGYADNLTIDRIDSNKNYCPENCRWITLENNSKYKSTTRIIEVNGIKHTGREWSKLLGYGVNYVNTMVRTYGVDYTIKFIKDNLS